ncbi:tigger transposable element-derived protein 4-like [Ruditapes philippinarum]|uniref:tigger transposable element-derived protein 4-like n=1 Tax=Ruditapes philippinarum TaxID=129788 RepID=UPI00295B2C9E|nr:tigger transposable element-derived protein 4-like [Ruditapes philippinarum]
MKKRNILLFVDNAPSHPNLSFSNMKVVYFPPNTTSRTQPMDQGIIQTTKLKFRKRQLLHLTKEIDRHPTATGTDLLKQITILDAIYWLKKSWNEVEGSTIKRCFEKSGFGTASAQLLDGDSTSLDRTDQEPSVNDQAGDDNDDDDVPLASLKLAYELFGCSYKELSSIDKLVHTCDTNAMDWSLNPHDILKNQRNQNGSISSDEEETPDLQTATSSISLSDAHDMVTKLKLFTVKSGNVSLMNTIDELNEQLTLMSVMKLKQTKISDFFNKQRTN